MKLSGMTHSGHLVDLDFPDRTILAFDFTFDILGHIQIPVSLRFTFRQLKSFSLKDILTRQG